MAFFCSRFIQNVCNKYVIPFSGTRENQSNPGRLVVPSKRKHSSFLRTGQCYRTQSSAPSPSPPMACWHVPYCPGWSSWTEAVTSLKHSWVTCLPMWTLKWDCQGTPESPTELYNIVFILAVWKVSIVYHSNEHHFGPKRGEPSEFCSLAKSFHEFPSVS